MANEVIKVDLLNATTTTANSTNVQTKKIIKLHPLARQVNDLYSEIERISQVNESLVAKIRDMKKQLKG